MKTYMQKIFLSLFMLCSVVAYAQNDCKVKGVVKDATGETIPYATVGAYQGKKNVTRLAADVDGVKAIFQSRIDAQVDGGAWYPESIEGWQNNSRIVTNGNFVMMIAWSLCEDAVADFNALF